MIVENNVCIYRSSSNALRELSVNEIQSVSGGNIATAGAVITVAGGMVVAFVGSREALYIFAGCSIYSQCALVSDYVTQDIGNHYVKTGLKAVVHTVCMAAAGCLLLAGTRRVLRYIPNELSHGHRE